MLRRRFTKLAGALASLPVIGSTARSNDGDVIEVATHRDAGDNSTDDEHRPIPDGLEERMTGVHRIALREAPAAPVRVNDLPAVTPDRVEDLLGAGKWVRGASATAAVPDQAGSGHVNVGGTLYVIDTVETADMPKDRADAFLRSRGGA